MSLFNLGDLTPAKKENASAIRQEQAIEKYVIGKAGKKIDELFSRPIPGTIVHFISTGDWSTHDLLFFFLKMTGPAEVVFTTWAISEYAIRQLYTFVNSGMITKLSGIFDYRNGVRKPAELQFLQQITTDIKPGKCHAKVTVITNENWGITINASANYTRNPRIEAGVISCNKETAAFYRTVILNELNNTSNLAR